MIDVKNLSKIYNVYDSPFDRLKQLFSIKKSKYYKEFLALDNISFTVDAGESIGIVGSNGSGKSTLLQIVCGTLNKSSGSVVVNGKVGALLELGSGFNPEFTGRENVYMNAMLLGLSKYEIDNLFESIVDFSGVREFIDQPVKNYSSGMALRLAFSVIANVQSEILIIDEALAVGDMAFQARCYKLLEDKKKSGQTFIIVSHDLNTLRNIADKIVWIEKGKLIAVGAASEILDRYIQFQHQLINSQLGTDIANRVDFDDAYGTGNAEIYDYTLCDANGHEKAQFIVGDDCVLTFRVKFHENIDNLALGFGVRNISGMQIIGMHSTNQSRCNLTAKVGEVLKAKFVFKNPLNVGVYRINLYAEKVFVKNRTHQFLMVRQNCIVFESIQSAGLENTFHSSVMIDCKIEVSNETS